MGGMWQDSRRDWSSLAALDHYSDGDFTAMRNAIKAVPDELKAFAKLAFIERLPSKVDKDTDPTLEFLTDARKELVSSYGSEDDRSGWYFTLLSLTFIHARENSPAILKEAIATLNRADDADDKRDRNEVSREGIWKNLPVSLIDMDEYAVKDAVASINSTWTRVGVRLALLQAGLDRMRSPREMAPPPKRKNASAG